MNHVMCELLKKSEAVTAGKVRSTDDMHPLQSFRAMYYKQRVPATCTRVSAKVPYLLTTSQVPVLAVRSCLEDIIISCFI